MIPITEEEEASLDKGYLHWERKDVAFDIDSKNIKAYGNIDFNKSSDDYKTLECVRWLDHLTIQGIYIPSNYNYKEHCSYSDRNRPLYYDTVNPAAVLQYIHGVLNKPERCCIFSKIVNKYVKQS